MTNFLRPLLAAAFAIAPVAAVAQYVIPEPPMAVAPVAVAPLNDAGPLNEEDAAMIAHMHGMAVVDDVDVRMWDGNFKVEGKDMTGDDIVMRIDHDTGDVLDIDD